MSTSDIFSPKTTTVESMTISDAAQKVLSEKGAPMSTDDIYKTIVAQGLYEFKAKDPIAVLKRTLRQRSNLIENPKTLMFTSPKLGFFTLAE